MQRRDALKLALGTGVTAIAAAVVRRNSDAVRRLTIAPIRVELSHGVQVHSLGFNGMVPGPQMDPGGSPSILELHNDSNSGIVFHSAALSQPWIELPAGGRACSRLLAGVHSYRAYCGADGAIGGGTTAVNLGASAAAGEVDQMQVLSICRWDARAINHPDAALDPALRYVFASFNDKTLSASEPIKVRPGERVFFHFFNSSIQGITLALPRHRFFVVALDGNRVPNPRHVERLHVGPLESIGAIVVMNEPGRWILGATHREDRAAGLGRLVEYAHTTGQPVHAEYGNADWDYSQFGSAEDGAPRGAACVARQLPKIQLVRRLATTDVARHDPTPLLQPLEVCTGERYRASVTNFTRAAQSLSLLGHDVELASVAGGRTRGVLKEIITVPSFTRIEFEFTAQAGSVFLAHNRATSVQPATGLESHGIS